MKGRVNANGFDCRDLRSIYLCRSKKTPVAKKSQAGRKVVKSKNSEDDKHKCGELFVILNPTQSK